ncbi:cytidylate kinase [Prolixibacter bellariivorans]|uniref:Cytidylate kinase n=1 Tax=Prolixibacter bellariivorans TaxID=314319 RepID=A0A5M4AWW7_9BACT|nr:(d)CMP kinase [Prolixibacter bellariivorans]GET32158.1 cytidylate kinase [Prolixibacter bellariivorans]
MSENKKIVIAVDGHSSCGKSTLAKALASRLNYAYIDTGAMYRAVTLYGLRNNLIAEGKVDEADLTAQLHQIKITFRYSEAAGKSETYLNGENVEEEIRQLPVSRSVSPVATIGEVRKHLVALQQEMGKNKGIVMDGRDIGTVVFPDAELKIYMTASPEVRAQRRYDELKAKGEDISFEEIKANVIERDYIDENREESPLRQADDAIVLDNSYFTPEEQLDWAFEKVMERLNRNGN